MQNRQNIAELVGLDALNELNNISQGWSETTKLHFLERLRSQGAFKSGKLARSLINRLKLDSGVVSKITFNFLRYGVFVDKGVGKGWPIERVGDVIAALNIGGGGNSREAKPWINVTLSRDIVELADRIAASAADMSVKAYGLNETFGK